MIQVLSVIVYALIVLIAVILVVLILIQPSKEGGLGAAFGGVGENVFGAHAMEHLSKLTVWLISIFFVLALLLTVLSAHMKRSDKSIMDGEKGVPEKVQTSSPADKAALPLPSAGVNAPEAVKERMKQ